MALQVTKTNDVRVYNVAGSGRKAIPDWLVQRRRNSLRYDPEWRKRIELIQDFEFPEASLGLKATRDGQYLVASGVYKPQFHVYDLNELSLKFDRHTQCESVQFEILSDDWTKTVFLQADRTIEFHTRMGLHFKTRIPKFGRDLAYNFQNCDLLTVGGGNEIYRLNLDQGRFMMSMATDSPELNTIAINPFHQLYAAGSPSGFVHLMDPRTRSAVANLNVAPAVSSASASSSLSSTSVDHSFSSCGVTAFHYFDDALTCAVGTTTGHVLLYDLRHRLPFIVRDHGYGLPIKRIQSTTAGGTTGDGQPMVVSADSKILKIWDRKTGKPFTSIEPPQDINDFIVYKNSGMVLMANEGTAMQSYYIPSLGPAPKWCSFLDNITEELEESSQMTIYDDYKFVTKKELSALSLDHLIGTNVVRAYMHGYFIDQRLYEKARAITNPFAYQEYRKRVIDEKVEKERASRISVKKRLPKVNKALAEQMLARQQSKSTKKPKKEAATDMSTEQIMADPRFADLFKNPDFEVDTNSFEYKLLHPTERKAGAPATAWDRYNQDDDDASDDSDY